MIDGVLNNILELDEVSVLDLWLNSPEEDIDKFLESLPANTISILK